MSVVRFCHRILDSLSLTSNMGLMQSCPFLSVTISTLVGKRQPTTTYLGLLGHISCLSMFSTWALHGTTAPMSELDRCAFLHCSTEMLHPDMPRLIFMTGKSKDDMDLVVFPRILNPIPLLKNTTYNVYLERVM